MRDIYILAPLIFVFLTTWLGFFVYEKNTRNPKNYFFLALMCVFVLADLFELKSAMCPDAASAKSFLMAQNLPFIFFPAVLFCFNNAYVDHIKIRSGWTYWAIIAPFVLVFLALARAMDSGAVSVAVTGFSGGFILYPNFPARAVFALYLITLIAAFYPFYGAYRSRAEKPEFFSEARFLFLSVFVPLTAALLVMIYIKRVTLGLSGNEVVYPFLLFPVAFFVSTMMLGLLTVRYKTLDATIIFNNAIVYSVLTVTLMTIYVIVQNFSENFFQQMFPSNNRIYGILSALVVAFVFEPLNSKISEFVHQIIEFVKSIDKAPEAPEGDGEKKHFEIRNLEMAYAAFAACYFSIFVLAKFIPGIPPRIAYVISGTALSATAMYVIYNIMLLPFNITAFSIISSVFVTAHVIFVSMTAGLNYYIEAFGAMISILMLISAAALIGRIIASRIDEIAFLIPLCVVAAAADLWSVFYGVTSELITKKSVALDYLLVRYPSLGAGQLRQFIGIADFLFASIFMGCVYNFGLNMKKNYAAFICAFTATFVIVAVTKSGVPAIPVLSLFFIAANIRLLRLKYEDVKTMAIVMAGSAVVFYVITSIRGMLRK